MVVVVLKCACGGWGARRLQTQRTGRVHCGYHGTCHLRLSIAIGRELGKIHLVGCMQCNTQVEPAIPLCDYSPSPPMVLSNHLRPLPICLTQLSLVQCELEGKLLGFSPLLPLMDWQHTAGNSSHLPGPQVSCHLGGTCFSLAQISSCLLSLSYPCHTPTATPNLLTLHG